MGHGSGQGDVVILLVSPSEILLEAREKMHLSV